MFTEMYCIIFVSPGHKNFARITSINIKNSKMYKIPRYRRSIRKNKCNDTCTFDVIIHVTYRVQSDVFLLEYRSNRYIYNSCHS